MPSNTARGLTQPQVMLLLEINAAYRLKVFEAYLPLRRLRDLGLVEINRAKYGSDLAHITKFGKEVAACL